MQYILAFIVVVILVILIIYKINNKFEKKEFLIFIAILVVTTTAFIFYDKFQEEKLPNLFKSEYEKHKKIKIEKLSYELLNNKNISSKKHFVYKFVYIINKNEQKYVCTLPKIEIDKIGDEYVFNLNNTLEEECQKQ